MNNQKLEIISTLNLGDISDFIKECIKEELRLLQVQQKAKDDQLITTEEAAKILGVSKVTLHNWKLKGKIKYYRIGTRIRFKRQDLLDTLVYPLRKV